MVWSTSSVPVVPAAAFKMCCTEYGPIVPSALPIWPHLSVRGRPAHHNRPELKRVMPYKFVWICPEQSHCLRVRDVTPLLRRDATPYTAVVIPVGVFCFRPDLHVPTR